MRKAGFILTLLAASLAVAQEPAGGDPPSRVVRLNYIQGQVSFRPGSVDEWTAATLNYPVYNGDHLWADQGAQAEMHIGSTAIRMGSETALAVLSLDDRMVQLSLTAGSLNVHVRSLGDGESFEVDTPNSSVTLLRAGDYRFQVDENSGTTTVSVHGGDTEINGGGRAFAVHAREVASMTGIDDTFSNVVSAERGFDGFDRWCQDRDRREEQSESARYVGREMTGYEDLDANGAWTQAPEYGWVWRPRTVAVGWEPYRFGHWAWVEPWGWTWVDDASWGFAPFHYGRWAHYRGGWVWVPGTMVARPVYAPALVAFVGGNGFSAAISFGGGGGVGWFPLGPHEVYRPAYHVSDVYVRRVNVTHVTVTNINVTNVTYVNRTYVTAVPRETFVGARPVHSSVVVMSPDVVTRAQVVTVAPVAPERVSVLGRATVVGRVAAPPTRVVERTVVVRNAPPPPPVSFAAKREALVANPGRPVDPQVNESLRRNDRFQRPAMVRSAAPGQVQQGPQQQIRTVPPAMRDNVQRPQGQQGQQPMRNDRPEFRQQQQQGQPAAQPQQNAPQQQNMQQGERFGRRDQQQQNPQNQQQPVQQGQPPVRPLQPQPNAPQQQNTQQGERFGRRDQQQHNPQNQQQPVQQGQPPIRPVQPQPNTPPQQNTQQQERIERRREQQQTQPQQQNPPQRVEQPRREVQQQAQPAAPARTEQRQERKQEQRRSERKEEKKDEKKQ